MDLIRVQVNLIDFALAKNCIDANNQKIHVSMDVKVIDTNNFIQNKVICAGCLNDKFHINDSLILTQRLSQLQ